jgi:hypothetical protein
MFEYWVKRVMNYNGSGQSRVESACSLSFVRGMIYEYRVMATEKSESRQHANALLDSTAASETED